MALPIVLLPDLIPDPAAAAVRMPAGAAATLAVGVLLRRRLDTLRGAFSVLGPAVRFNGVPYCVLGLDGVEVAP